jgi:oligopeptide/dipeptide ABC transporter ATP-binding protein
MQLIQSPPGKIVDGQILFYRGNGNEYAVDIAALDPRGAQMRSIRGGEIAMVFQEPMTSLNPLYAVGKQIAESVQLHQGVSKREAMSRALEMLYKVRIADPEQRPNEYPHQLSGGMRQRVMIAMALSCNPAVLIADGPVSALDVSIQAQVLNLLQQLQRDLGLTLLFIAHDLSVVEHISDRIAVMYVGKLVEMAETDVLLGEPLHPYTEALISAVPPADPDIRLDRIVLDGDVPSPANPPPGCVFHPRCHYAQNTCRVQEPQLVEVRPGHYASCHYAADLTLQGIGGPT